MSHANDFGSGRPETRLVSSVPVDYWPYQNSILSGTSLDISTGGLFLQSELRFDCDERLYLKINLPHRDAPVTCRARVAWLNPSKTPRKQGFPPGVGLEFTDLDPDDRKTLGDFIKGNAPREGA